MRQKKPFSLSSLAVPNVIAHPQVYQLINSFDIASYTWPITVLKMVKLHGNELNDPFSLNGYVTFFLSFKRLHLAAGNARRALVKMLAFCVSRPLVMAHDETT